MYLTHFDVKSRNRNLEARKHNDGALVSVGYASPFFPYHCPYTTARFDLVKDPATVCDPEVVAGVDVIDSPVCVSHSPPAGKHSVAYCTLRFPMATGRHKKP